MKAHNKNRPLDLDALLAVWQAPSPTPGFADRVLAACDTPSPRRLARPAQPDRSSLWWFAAVAAVVVLLPLWVMHRSEAGAPSPTSIASIVEPDAGTQRD